MVVTYYLKKFYYDTALSASPTTFTTMEKLAGTTQILFGSDYVFANEVFTPFIGINAPSVLPNLIEWATKFILPWIVLYWIIRLVKCLEKINSFSKRFDMYGLIMGGKICLKLQELS